MNESGALETLLIKQEETLLHDWLRAQSSKLGDNRISVTELRSQSREFLSLLRGAIAEGSNDIEHRAFAPVRELLTSVSRSRSEQGFSPTETATFIFSLKEPLFALLRKTYSNQPELVLEESLRATELVDRLGLFTTEAYQKSREEVIARQQQDMLELSTPVVKLWNGILALPLIGTLDSSRTQVVMESLLQAVVQQSAQLAIIDITGVPTVDTLVAQHLMKTVTAARLMGAECIISGIRPQIAQTIVHLGVDLSAITTKASLADAFAVALQRRGMRIVSQPTRSTEV